MNPPDLIGSARLLGAWSWSAARTFEVVGNWVRDEPDPEVKIQFFAHSRRRGAHSISLAGLLPIIAGSDPADWIAPIDDRDPALFESMARLDGTLERLGSLYEELLPREIAEYRGFLSSSYSLADMPAIRIVAAIMADQQQDLQVGTMLTGVITSVASEGP
ncbi:MAG TPA: hypothetical protein VMU77_06465 [Acidimicrobiales bacterium]|nr:hypothetical protein [Acidimicrobiales bacterium]